MIFTSISFIYYFLPIVIVLYFLIPNKFRNFILLLASLMFYFYGEQSYVLLMLAEILIAYLGALLINRFHKRSIFVLIIAIHLSLLIFFKYTSFFISNINFAFNTSIPFLEIALPIGISFYTFQILSYVIDVYNGKVPVQKNFFSLATYVALFPQLIAGPIVRYDKIALELKDRKSTLDDISSGIRLFCIGLGKKVLIANMLGLTCSDFLATDEKSIVFYWLYAISYMLQVYFDFSAYSDMAIGLGRIFGFHFLENFNYPFISKSITEFWHRWHISLSTWFKDYVYIPLGGNKKGLKIQIRNILIVWMLTGIWHGASWNFLIWGLLFGVVLIIEKLFLNSFLDKIPDIFKRCYVLLIVLISFIIFASTDMSEALSNIIGLFGGKESLFINQYTIYVLRNNIVILLIAIIGSTPLLKSIVNKLKSKPNTNKIVNLLEPVVIIAILFITTAYLVDNSYNPFLYFRF